MPYTTQTSDFWGWYLRHNNRTVWSHFFDAGIDVFSVGPSSNPQAFLEIENLLPAMSGGFSRRWGAEQLLSHSYGTTPSVIRTFLYNTPQDSSDPGNTANTNLWIGTDNQAFYTYLDNATLFTGHGPANWGAAGEVTAVTSRSWFYYGDGVHYPRKVNPSYTTANTESIVGIKLTVGGFPAPDYRNSPSFWTNSSNFIGVTTYTESSGYGYLVAPTVTITDAAGSGTGAVITTSIGVNGEVNGYSITSPGSGYVQATATLTAPPGGGRQASLVLYTQVNSAAPNFGQVVGADFGGPMQFNGGRQYTVALQNSLTGHTSDVNITGLPAGQTTGQFLQGLLGNTNATTAASATVLPVYNASTNAQAGFSQIEGVISVPAAALDVQVDTVILLAGADGQGVSTLYEVTTVPLSSFTLASGYYQYYYADILPDTYSDKNNTGNTLLAADVWAETDSFGDTNGIFLNMAPPLGMKYFTLHQGRMFATDGKTVFYSKSLDEVTTSTGLITSKWEEAWPGDYQLPLALNNEDIVAIKSDGVTLHVGTEKGIFTVYGSDPSSFSVPSVQFAETGVLNNDAWSVIFSEGQPAGFVWVTPDYKVMHSDFSTYRDIGTGIYPILQKINPARTNTVRVMSSTQGPYNFVFITVPIGTNASELYIWESRLQKWYHWNINTSKEPASYFVYQYPGYTNSVSDAPGTRYLFWWDAVSNVLSVQRLNPANTSDYGGAFPIPWFIQTSWQDLGDPTAIKTINEIEIVGEDSPFTVSLYGATSQQQFDSGGTLLKTGSSVTGPIASLGTNKFYCAGASTTAKFYSIVLASLNSSFNALPLTSFSIEAYPMSRI